MSQADTNGTAADAAMSMVADPVRGAISRAAQSTGVDFSYLLAQARLESSLNPSAHAATSSAAGLYQFTRGTWGTMLARHGGALGLGSALSGAQPGAGLATASVSQAQLMALRYDPNAAAMMAAQLAGDNTRALTGTLGRTPTSAELYLAHFLGLAGATRFLGALNAAPAQAAAAVLPQAAAANRAVFFDSAGAPRSVSQVMALIDGRMAVALNGPDQGAAAPSQDSWQPPIEFDPAIAPAPAAMPSGSGVLAQQFAAAQKGAAVADDPDGTPPGPSMAQTLLNTFADGGSGGEEAAPALVRTAYGQMQAWGL